MNIRCTLLPASSWEWAHRETNREGIDWEVRDYSKFRSFTKRKAFDRGGNDMSRLLDLGKEH